MTKLAACSCAALSFLAASCATERRPEMPEDQATKIRQHRVAPSEDLEDKDRAKEGSPVPPTKEGSWKF